MRLQKYSAIAVIVLAPFILMGGQCNPNATPEEIKPGTFTGDFADGGSFLSTSAKATDQGTTINVLAKQDIIGSRPDEFVLVVPKQTTLPYTVTVPGDAAIVEYCQNLASGACHQFFARAGQGSVTLTVTALTPTFQGTFNGTLIQRGAADSVRVVTNAAFNANYD